MIDLTQIQPKFELGHLVATPGALELGINFAPYINRHIRGDWGNICKEDWEQNDIAVSDGYRIFSVYKHEGSDFWIITEADRSSTCVLLPSDY